MTLREKFLARTDVRRDRITLSIDGDSFDVEVRAVSIAASERIAKANEKGPAQGAIQFLLEAVIDPTTNEKLFRETDRERLSELTQAQIQPLIDAYSRIPTPSKDEVGKG